MKKTIAVLLFAFAPLVMIARDKSPRSHAPTHTISRPPASNAPDAKYLNAMRCRVLDLNHNGVIDFEDVLIAAGHLEETDNVLWALLAEEISEVLGDNSCEFKF
jgi:hypothetical protein